MEKLKVGDVVKLKSGSPEMTVCKIGVKKSGFADSEKCVVEWFDNGFFETVTVSITSLIKIK